MNKKILFYLCFFAFASLTFGQNNVGVGTTTPDVQAALDIQQGTAAQGMYMPRLKAGKRISMTGINTGMLVYDLDSLCLFQWNGSIWKSLCSQSAAVVPVKKAIKRYYSIAAVEFDAFDTQFQFAAKPRLLNGSLVELNAGSAGVAVAGVSVNLPQGAVVDSMYAYLSDNASSIADIELYKVDLFNPSPFPLTAEILIGEINTNTNSTTLTKYGIKCNSNNVVDNDQFAYYVVYRQKAGDSIKNYGVRLAYTIQGY